MTTIATHHLNRLSALIEPWALREEQFSAAARALAALPNEAADEDREVLLAWLDAIMQSEDFPDPEQLVHFPLSIRNHLLAPPILWPERRFGDWIAVHHPMAALRVAARRDNMIKGIRLRQRGYVAWADPTISDGLLGEIGEHVVELGGEMLRLDGNWWLPTLPSATMIKLRWSDALGGRLVVRACEEDGRCDLPAEPAEH